MAHRYMCDICYRTHTSMREARACERRCALKAAGEFVREEIRHREPARGDDGGPLWPRQGRLATGSSVTFAVTVALPRPSEG